MITMVIHVHACNLKALFNFFLKHKIMQSIHQQNNIDFNVSELNRRKSNRFGTIFPDIDYL